MKKKVRVLLLSIIILSVTGILGFAVLGYWAFHSEQTSFPNRLWQYLFWKIPLVERMFLINPAIRKSLGFVFSGDDKYDFLGKNSYKEILVEIDYESNSGLLSDLEKEIKEVISSVIPDKDVKVVVSNGNIELGDNEEFDPRLYRNFYSQDSVKALHLVFLPSGSTSFPSWYGGVTYSADTIIIFLRKSSFPKINRYLIKHRFAHEFGHLIDLKHVDDRDCVMYYATLESVNEMTESFFSFIESDLEKLKSKEDKDAYAEIFFSSRYCQKELDNIAEAENPPLIRFGVYPGSYYYTDEPID